MEAKRKRASKVDADKSSKRSKSSRSSVGASDSVSVQDTKPEIDKSVFDTTPSQDTKHGRSFYAVECTELARKLLGQEIVRVVDGKQISGIIVETEAYLGILDKAAHSFEGKRTEKTEAMYMQPGTSYVYYIYGLYCCFNISSEVDGCAVLIRALEPRDGQDNMMLSRSAGRKSSGAKLKTRDLCSGPSKLCAALQITKPLFNKTDLCTSDTLFLRPGPEVASSEVVACPRVGINYAGEWVVKPLRFYLRGNEHVSQRDKKAEAQGELKE